MWQSKAPTASTTPPRSSTDHDGCRKWQPQTPQGGGTAALHRRRAGWRSPQKGGIPPRPAEYLSVLVWLALEFRVILSETSQDGIIGPLLVSLGRPATKVSSMIICHCTHITDHDIRAAVSWMRDADPDTIITPGKIYHALGKSADCGGCMPLFLDTMRSSGKLEVPAPLTNLRGTAKREKDHAGRPQGHRLSQQGAAS